jgi:hypothetical protein
MRLIIFFVDIAIFLVLILAFYGAVNVAKKRGEKNVHKNGRTRGNVPEKQN